MPDEAPITSEASATEEAAPVEAEAAPAEAVEAEAPEVEESLADTVRRHATPQEDAVEKPEAEEVEATEAEAEAPAEEAEAEEGADTEKYADSQYTVAEVQQAVQDFEAGEDSPDYEKAFGLLEELDLIEYEEPAAEGEPEFADDDNSIEARVWRMEQAEAQRQTEADERRQAELIRENEEAFYADLDKNFVAEGEQFPRDPKEWTPEQQLQARLTSNMEDGSAAKDLLTKFGDAAVEAYVNSKEDAKEIPNTDGAAAQAKNDDDLDPRKAYAEVAKRHLTGQNVGAG